MGIGETRVRLPARNTQNPKYLAGTGDALCTVPSRTQEAHWAQFLEGTGSTLCTVPSIQYTGYSSNQEQ
jgi:hypothetical protein